jgi:chorismate mutase/prephenate dehydratase
MKRRLVLWTNLLALAGCAGRPSLLPNSDKDLRKTSVMFVTSHERGALLSCLNVLAGHNLNLTKLESRPMPGRPFEYQFYVDFEGNVADANVQRALDEMVGLTRSLKIFGSYPARTSAARAAD